MKTIPEIVNFFNDDQVYITTEDRPIFTFADLKKQIDWTNDKILYEVKERIS